MAEHPGQREVPRVQEGERHTYGSSHLRTIPRAGRTRGNSQNLVIAALVIGCVILSVFCVVAVSIGRDIVFIIVSLLTRQPSV